MAPYFSRCRFRRLRSVWHESPSTDPIWAILPDHSTICLASRDKTASNHAPPIWHKVRERVNRERNSSLFVFPRIRHETRRLDTFIPFYDGSVTITQFTHSHVIMIQHHIALGISLWYKTLICTFHTSISVSILLFRKVHKPNFFTFIFRDRSNTRATERRFRKRYDEGGIQLSVKSDIIFEAAYCPLPGDIPEVSRCNRRRLLSRLLIRSNLG